MKQREVRPAEGGLPEYTVAAGTELVLVRHAETEWNRYEAFLRLRLEVWQ